MTTESLVTAPLAERKRSDARARARGKTFFKQLFKQSFDHAIDDVGAMMAYYAILALFPMLVFVVSLALVVLPDTAVSDGVHMATRALPVAARTLIEDRVMSLSKAAGTGFAIGGAAIALFGASRGTVALMGALGRLYGKKETRSWVRRQLIAVAITACVAILIVSALSLLVAGPVFGHWLGDRFGLGETFDQAWAVLRWIGAGVLVMVVWAMLYKFLPNTDAPFRIFTPGALIGVTLWLGISLLFGLYLSNFNSYETTYGALGGGIIFLTWLWLSNMALLLGAEINDVLADLRCPKSDAACQLSKETQPTPKVGGAAKSA